MPNPARHLTIPALYAWPTLSGRLAIFDNGSASDFYRRALHRIRVLTLVLGAIGTVGLLTIEGFRAGIGFLLGTGLSIVNFQGIQMLANALGGAKKPGILAGLFIALRYLLVGVALYVILKLLGFNAVPVLAGLLTPFGAALLEILYELIFPVHA